MTKFEDGPAAGQTLMLKRAPMFLRVTEAAGQWDALDQLEDKPRAGETLHAYQVQGEVGGMHLNRRGGTGGFFVIATYRHVPEQPDDATMRDAIRWRQWCLAHQPKP